METKLFELILEVYINNKYKEMYNNKVKDFNLYLDINDDITFDILIDFNNHYFDTYKNILLENALIYAYQSNDNTYIEHLKTYNKEIPLDNNVLFQAMTTKLAYKNLYNKIVNKINNDQTIKEKYKETFEQYHFLDIKNITYINNLYRNILFNYLKNFDKEDFIIILDTLIYTNNYDGDFINKLRLNIKEEELLQFKYIIVKLILNDVYLHLNSLKNEEMYELENEFEDYEQDMLLEIENNILEYIENKLENNISLPEDEDLRYNIYSIFINYNIYMKNYKYDYENIKHDKENIKKLKKIYPLYFLDLIDEDNE